MIEDQCHTSTDMIARMMFDEFTLRMVPINASNPTPRLDLEIKMDNMVSYKFNVLPDNGFTRAVVAKNVAEDMGLKWDPMTYNHVLTDAQGRRMAVEGLTIIKVRAKPVNGDLQCDSIESFFVIYLLKHLFLSRSP